jgi:erythromycin esterase-like protein
VTAADDWGGPAERKNVRPALPGSVEELFHKIGDPAFALPLRGRSRAADVLRDARLERAIGVVYRPSSERDSHYFRARASDQFDVAIHLDQTRAVEPIERTAGWERGEVPETFPHAV